MWDFFSHDLLRRHASCFNVHQRRYIFLIDLLPKALPVFDYEDFFKAQIDKKKKDHTYRVFKKVMRKGTEFPFAQDYARGKKDITVWCSNDYLGMSWHPKVTSAVR